MLNVFELPFAKLHLVCKETRRNCTSLARKPIKKFLMRSWVSIRIRMQIVQELKSQYHGTRVLFWSQTSSRAPTTFRQSRSYVCRLISWRTSMATVLPLIQNAALQFQGNILYPSSRNTNWKRVFQFILPGWVWIFYKSFSPFVELSFVRYFNALPGLPPLSITFFLWEYLKERVYSWKFENSEHLKAMTRCELESNH